ncbi:MAG: [CysO sulfur-carrier protein]-S-L-cysteine hydrolase [Actinomycetota bacterium]|nr:[CysO sulfur-carrier protein]-S-L-cysteine hydrolase [Actinomycetota bacterium]
MARSLADEMVAHLNEERPNEGCGLVAGKGGAVSKVIKMSNAMGSPMRYSLDPQEQFAAYRLIEDEGLELAGVFHSHTHTEAFPSPTDVRLASEDVPYIIVSLAHEPADIKAFRIVKLNWDDSEGEIVEVPVAIEG